MCSIVLFFLIQVCGHTERPVSVSESEIVMDLVCLRLWTAGMSRQRYIEPYDFQTFWINWEMGVSVTSVLQVHSSNLVCPVLLYSLWL